MEGNHINVEGAHETNSRGCNSQYRGVMMWPLIVNSEVIRDAKGNGENNADILVAQFLLCMLQLGS